MGNQPCHISILSKALWIIAEDFHFHFHQSNEPFFLCSQCVFEVPFCKFYMPFSRIISSWPLCCKAYVCEVLPWLLSFQEDLIANELIRSVRVVLGFDQGPSWLAAQFVRMSVCLGVWLDEDECFSHLLMMEPFVFLWNLTTRIYIYWRFLKLHGRLSTPTCTGNSGSLIMTNSLCFVVNYI